MAKADWGLKRICPHCGTRYYDMKKNPPVCPACGATFDPESLVKTRRGKAAAAAAEEKAKKAAPVVDLDDLPIVEGDDSDNAVIEDADELGEDSVDVEDVVEVAADEDDSR